VYEELRHVARAKLRAERPGHVLQTTALVHEAYLRLIDINRMDVRNRGHLLSLIARLMRRILVDEARKRGARKRGGSIVIVGLNDAVPSLAAEAVPVDVLSLNTALEELGTYDARLCQVVEAKFFAGMNTSETAEALGVSTATVERDWTVARAWLHQRLSARAVNGLDAAAD
jgi:RNA polymerase sigma factor (TIGR02999 family)